MYGQSSSAGPVADPRASPSHPPRDHETQAPRRVPTIRESLESGWVKLACGLWILAWILFVLRVVARPDSRGVYPIFETAVHRWWQGLPIYGTWGELDLFRYSPAFSVLFSPFALLPGIAGIAIWQAVSLILLFAALRSMLFRLLPGRWGAREEGVLLCLALLGAYRGFWSAQTNAIVVALALFGCVAILDRRWWTAALCLTVPVFIKLWPIALVLFAVWFWPRPLIARLGAWAVALASLPFLTRPWAQVLGEYRSFVETTMSTAPVRWDGYRDAWTILEQVVVVNPRAYVALQGLGAVLAFSWVLRQARRGLGTRHLLMCILSAWATWQLLLGPASERLTYGLIAPFTAAAVVLSGRAERWRLSSRAAWWMTVILGAGEVERRLLPLVAFSPAIQPMGVVVFAVWLARADWSACAADATVTMDVTESADEQSRDTGVLLDPSTAAHQAASQRR